MESINQLRKICQSTRPSIFTDFLSKIYYRLSIYFTWACLHLKMTANQVTFLSGAFAILGGLLISTDSKGLVILGAVFFHIFAILDMSDGEVARYRKEGGVEGHYLDWYMHFVSSTALVIGLFLASRESFQSMWLMLLGLLAVITPILDKTVQNAGWTVICWTRLRDIKNNNEGSYGESADEIEQKKTGEIKPKSWLYRRFRFLLLAPLQDHWLPLILLLLASLDWLFFISGIEVIDYRFPLIIYIGIVGPVCLYARVRRLVKTKALQDGYKRLFCNRAPLKFPEDDFL
jgi:hypothetical protein